MTHYALLGRRLGHSRSPQHFAALFARLGLEGHTYSLHEAESLDGLRQWIEAERIAGFNVTIPYKQAIVPLLDSLAPEAEAIGAVNCVCVERTGGGLRLVGHNTDAPAFGQTLREAGLHPRRAYVLGTGGAARAVAHALTGVDCTFVSRAPHGAGQVGYGTLRSTPLPADTLIVNATPVGMHPDCDHSPLDLRGLRVEDAGRVAVYDLVYNPSPTLLLRQAAAMGMRTMDGQAMLHLQADLSWALWQRR